MKVTYTGKMDIGGFGIGTSAWHQVKPLIEEDLLEIVYAEGGAKVPEKYFRQTPDWALSTTYEVQDLFFDAFCTIMMTKEPEILQTWGSHCLFQLRSFPKAISIVNLYSAHPVVQHNLMKGEGNYVPRPVLMQKIIKELEECDHIFIPSEWILKSLREFGLDHKAKLVPFGVDLEKFTPRDQPREDNIFRVIFVGSNPVRKGLIYLLRAWKKLNLSNAELVIAGVPADIKNPHPDLKNIKWGWVPDLVKAYQDSDVLCLPTLEDGCPLVTYEAMACGIPPIITDTTGTEQHIYNGTNGLIIESKSVNVIAEALQMCYDNRERVRQMGKMARTMAEAFPWERHEQAYVKWIKSL